MLSAVRNFFIALFISLVVFGLVGGAVTEFALDSVGIPRIGEKETAPPAPETAAPVETGTKTDPTDPIKKKEGLSLTALLVVSDYQPDVFDDYDLSEANADVSGFPAPERRVRADTLLLVHMESGAKTLLLCRIPANTRIVDKGITKQLGAVLGDSGSDALRGKVEAMIGIPIDYYAELSYSGLASFVDEIGGVEYKVPRDMTAYFEEEGFTIKLHKGLQKLTGNGALQLLRFDGYGDDGSARLTQGVALFRAIADKMTGDRAFYDNAKTLYPILSSFMETDFGEDALAKYLDAFFLYPEMEVTSVSYPGQSVTADGILYYEINLVSGRAVFSPFKYTGK